MAKVLENRYLDDETRKSLSGKAETTESRVKNLLGDKAAASDPLAALPSAKRGAYQHIISLIYECSANRIAAGALVERLIRRLSTETRGATPKKTKQTFKSTTVRDARRA
jgi:molecular chaperone HtpG